MEEIKEVFKLAYSKKIRFRSYTGAVTFYERYAMRTTDKERILERYEDRLSMVALTVGRNFEEVKEFIEILANRQLQGATPVFMNSGKLRAGNLVSCHQLRVEDNLESINYVMNSSAQMSKVGAGVGLNLTTYIDPSKFNNIFAQTSLDSQNFWAQISVDMTARRKMSAKVMPNL